MALRAPASQRLPATQNISTLRMNKEALRAASQSRSRANGASARESATAGDTKHSTLRMANKGRPKSAKQLRRKKEDSPRCRH